MAVESWALAVGGAVKGDRAKAALAAWRCGAFDDGPGGAGRIAGGGLPSGGIAVVLLL
jgi:hypothetical protein